MRICLLFLFIFALPLPSLAKKRADPETAYVKMLALTEMRQSLAATLDNRTGLVINEDVFKQTCGKVGQELQTWAAANYVRVRQASDRFRNPANAASEKDMRMIELFRSDPKLDRQMDGKKLYVRIPVVQSCLHCHGEKNARPDFIKIKYPQDKAFGYKPGDLRGVYSVSF